MRSIAKVLAILPLWVASQTLSQSTAKIQQKVVFVRPDPIIVGLSAVSHLSADPVGGVIHSQEDPATAFHAAAGARMNTLSWMDPDGSGITDLKIHGYDRFTDGTRIAFCSLRDDQYSQLYVANSDGSQEKQITKITTGDSCGPVWPHDGKRTAFTAMRCRIPAETRRSG